MNIQHNFRDARHWFDIADVCRELGWTSYPYTFMKSVRYAERTPYHISHLGLLPKLRKLRTPQALTMLDWIERELLAPTPAPQSQADIGVNPPTSTALTTYDFNGTDVRIVVRDGEPLFFALDICRQLELSSFKGGYGHHLKKLHDDEVVSASDIGVNLPGSGAQHIRLVTESGFYKLVLRSEKPIARQFQDWVTRHVLPTIRKTGAYIAGEEHGLTELELLEAVKRKIESYQQLTISQYAALNGHYWSLGIKRKLSRHTPVIGKREVTLRDGTTSSLNVYDRQAFDQAVEELNL